MNAIAPPCPLSADLLRPAELGPAERAAWAALQAGSAGLQVAFLSAEFARACEMAHGRVRVAVLHESGTIRGFFPFQFRSAWHQRIGLAECAGGTLSDATGIVAAPDLDVSPGDLLRLCRLGSLFVDHLIAQQTGHGLSAAAWQIGHRIDLATGSAAYFADLAARHHGFVQDTGRRLRRAAREFGPLTFTTDRRPAWAEVADLIAAKRAQYRRTGVADAFADPASLRLLEALLSDPAPACQPMLTVLRAGERVLARHFGLMCGGVLSYWFPIYDPEAQPVSPGRLLLWHTLQAGDTLGLTLIDRGAGDSAAKRDFSTGISRFGRAHWVRASLRGAVARVWQSAEWRLARRLTAWRTAASPAPHGPAGPPAP